MDEFFANFVHEFKYEICTNSYEFLHEKLVMLRMACTVDSRAHFVFCKASVLNRYTILAIIPWYN